MFYLQVTSPSGRTIYASRAFSTRAEAEEAMVHWAGHLAIVRGR